MAPSEGSLAGWTAACTPATCADRRCRSAPPRPSSEGWRGEASVSPNPSRRSDASVAMRAVSADSCCSGGAIVRVRFPPMLDAWPLALPCGTASHGSGRARRTAGLGRPGTDGVRPHWCTRTPRRPRQARRSAAPHPATPQTDAPACIPVRATHGNGWYAFGPPSGGFTGRRTRRAQRRYPLSGGFRAAASAVARKAACGARPSTAHASTARRRSMCKSVAASRSAATSAPTTMSASKRCGASGLHRPPCARNAPWVKES